MNELHGLLRVDYNVPEQIVTYRYFMHFHFMCLRATADKDSLTKEYQQSINQYHSNFSIKVAS